MGLDRHALKRTGKEGPLETSQGPDRRVDDTTTDRGDSEFERPLRDALRRPALAFLTALPRAEAIALLEERLKALEAELAEVTPHPTDLDHQSPTPPTPHPDSDPGRAAVEKAVEDSELEWTHVRPGEFVTNTLDWAEQVRTAGVVRQR